MSSNHTHNWWRAAILGALDGVLFGGAAEISRELYNDYRERQTVESFRSLDMTTPLMVDLLHWWAIPLWATVFFILVSVLIHKLLAGRVKSPLVLWQVIGIAGARHGSSSGKPSRGWAALLSVRIRLSQVRRGVIGSYALFS